MRGSYNAGLWYGRRKNAAESPLSLPRTRAVFSPQRKGLIVNFKLLIASACLATMVVPVAAQAQGVPGGVAHGVYEGNRRAGPVGAVVGGAVGGVIGGVEGILGVNHNYDNRSYDPYYSERPRPVYRQRRVVRSKVKQTRRVHRYRSSQR
jgi:hypothetical protein